MFKYNLSYDYRNVSSTPNYPSANSGSPSPAATPPALSAQTSPETSMRLSELSEILQLYHKQYTVPRQASALQDAVQAYFTGNAEPKEERYYNEYEELLGKLEKRIAFLSDEEYGATFEKLTGIPLSEYRKQKAENKDFHIEKLSVDETPERRVHVENRIDDFDYGAETSQRYANRYTDKKEQNLNATSKQYNDGKEQEIALISDAFSLLIDVLPCGTSKNDVEKALLTETKNLESLKEVQETKDIELFRLKFKEITGKDFRIKNFIQLDEAKKKYDKALVANIFTQVKTTLTENKWNSNYNLETYADSIYDPDQPHFNNAPSPLEKALLILYNGDKQQVVNWIQEGIGNFGLENATKEETYRVLQNALLRVSEAFSDKDAEENFEKYESEYKAALEKAYGKNIPKETLDAYISTKETAHALAKVGILLGTYSLGLGIFAESLLVGGAMGTYEYVKTRDTGCAFKEGFTSGLYNLTYCTSLKAGKAIPKAAIINNLMQNGIKPEAAANIARVTRLLTQASVMYSGDMMVADMTGDEIDPLTELLVCLGFSAIDAGFIRDNNATEGIFETLDRMGLPEVAKKSEFGRKKLPQALYVLIHDLLEQSGGDDEDVEKIRMRIQKILRQTVNTQKTN